MPYPKDHPGQPVQTLVTSVDRSDYVGRIAIGRVFSGTVRQAQQITVIDKQGRHTQQKIVQLYTFDGLGKKPVDLIEAGDICAIAGLDPVDIGNTIACADNPSALPAVTIDEPTMHMTFRINDGPFAGREGKYVAARQIKERLEKELQTNIALRMEPGHTAEEFKVSGRGLMHLGILLENMRREGYELCVGKPNVIIRYVDGLRQEPIERLVVECPIDCQNAVMSLMGDRRSELLCVDNKTGTGDYIHMEFLVPTRGLFGLHARVMTLTQGRAVMHHNFERYEPMRGSIPQRQAVVMIATESGIATAYVLDALFDRGTFFIQPGEPVYEGQVIGEHCKDNDIPVNVTRAKHQTNIRASGKDDAARVKPPRRMSLEQTLEYIQDDELVEITPESIRMRKRLLKEADRRREARKVKTD